MDFTIFNKINLLSPESLEELRLFINSLLNKQEDAIPVNPLAEMEEIPVPTDIIINRYAIYEDNFINRL